METSFAEKIYRAQVSDTTGDAIYSIVGYKKLLHNLFPSFGKTITGLNFFASSKSKVA
jgi:hypothetical protein